jgi:AraC-like DNA-binding protein
MGHRFDGLSNPAYFAECFRKQFGVRPSEYFKPFKKARMGTNTNLWLTQRRRGF